MKEGKQEIQKVFERIENLNLDSKLKQEIKESVRKLEALNFETPRNFCPECGTEMKHQKTQIGSAPMFNAELLVQDLIGGSRLGLRWRRSFEEKDRKSG